EKVAPRRARGLLPQRKCLHAPAWACCEEAAYYARIAGRRAPCPAVFAVRTLSGTGSHCAMKTACGTRGPGATRLTLPVACGRIVDGAGPYLCSCAGSHLLRRETMPPNDPQQIFRRYVDEVLNKGNMTVFD